MTLRRKIAELLRRVAREIDDQPADNVLRTVLAPRRINSTTGTAEYFDDTRGVWVGWREWLQEGKP